ncbi:MAG: hypothetical protein I8H77_09420 [Comamonadaceae bacterium]|nr:hypothetical protein [Comamonadaceae bacterium]
MQLTHQVDIQPFNHTLLAPHPLPRVRGCENLHLTQTNGVKNFSISHSGDVPSLKNEPSLFNLSNSLPISFNASEYLDEATPKELGKIWESIEALKSRIADLENVKAGTPGQFSQFIDQLPSQANRFIAHASSQWTSLVGENAPSRLASFAQSLPGLTYDIFQSAAARITEFTGKEMQEVPSQVSAFFSQLPEWTSGFFTSAHFNETTASAKQFAGQIGTYVQQLAEFVKTSFAHMPEVKFEDLKNGAQALKDQLMQSTMSLIAQGDALLKEYSGQTNASFVISTSVAIGITAIAIFAASFFGV